MLGCGPILTEMEMKAKFTRCPIAPTADLLLDKDACLYALSRIEDIHRPCPMGLALGRSLDLLVRRGLELRDPRDPKTWGDLYGVPSGTLARRPLILVVRGMPGTGKSQALVYALESMYTRWYIHETFPHVVGPFKQWLYVMIDVPASGSLVELMTELMEVTQELFETREFEADLSAKAKNGPAMLRRWSHVARRHFLGVLVLDEVQNFFKQAPVRERRKQQYESGRAMPEPLRLKEDEALKAILTFSNTSSIPLVASGTDDGVAAFMSRVSTGQRSVRGGDHCFRRIATAEDSYFRNSLWPGFKAQLYASDGIEDEKLVAETLVRESGGIRRVMAYVWISGQRVMLEDALTGRPIRLKAGHLLAGIDRYMDLLKPALAVLKSGDPSLMRRFSDLLPPEWYSRLSLNSRERAFATS